MLEHLQVRGKEDNMIMSPSIEDVYLWAIEVVDQWNRITEKEVDAVPISLRIALGFLHDSTLPTEKK